MSGHHGRKYSGGAERLHARARAIGRYHHAGGQIQALIRATSAAPRTSSLIPYHQKKTEPLKTNPLIAVFAIAVAAHAQTPAPAEEQVYQVGAGVSQPRVVQQVQPEHPAKGFRISGTVLIGLVVGSDGEPRDVHVIKTLEKDIDQSAVEAVRKWRFEPATKDGKPVAVK